MKSETPAGKNPICSKMCFFSAGQPRTKGGYCEEEKIINLNLYHYLEFSPKKQASQLGGQNPYIKGTCTTELKKNYWSEVMGTLGKSFYETFLTIIFLNKGK